MSNINVLIDNLHKKIIAYKEVCERLRKATIKKDFIRHQVENLSTGEFSEDDHLRVEQQWKENNLDIEYLEDEVEIALYAIKFDAYRLGRPRPTRHAEP